MGVQVCSNVRLEKERFTFYSFILVQRDVDENSYCLLSFLAVVEFSELLLLPDRQS